MASHYLNSLTQDQRLNLIHKLYEIQSGNCFICDQAINLVLQGDSLDIDHIEPLAAGGGRCRRELRAHSRELQSFEASF